MLATVIATVALVVAVYAAVRARRSPTVDQLAEILATRDVASVHQPTDPRLRTLED